MYIIRFFFCTAGGRKTTYLRDCIRLLSKGNHLRAGKKVGVVDERSEIAALPGNSAKRSGPRTDVLDNCPKEHGIHMLLRSMSPQIIAVDELGLPEDFCWRWQTVPGAGYRSLEPYMPAVS